MSLDSWSKTFNSGNEKANVFTVPIGDNRMVFVVDSITETDSSCMGFNTWIFNFDKISSCLVILFAITNYFFLCFLDASAFEFILLDCAK